ncbi:MAG: hypothetical protein WCF90_04865 [Methanomicrobiales archaeon]
MRILGRDDMLGGGLSPSACGGPPDYHGSPECRFSAVPVKGG